MNIGGNTITLPGGVNTLNAAAGNFGFNIIKTGINTLLFGIALVSLFFIVFGGIKWITSEGDPKKIEGARNAIVYACIGLGIAFLSFLIVTVFARVIGLNPTP